MPVNKKKKTLICVYDALCGWCFGFGPVLQQLEEKFSGQFNFEIISGGMITGKAVGPLSNMAAFISKAYPVVEQQTGIRFGTGFLEKLSDGEKILFSSLEPGNILTVLKEMAPGEKLKAAHEIQSLIYGNGINPADYHAYRPLFEKRNLDWHRALSLLQSAETSQLTVLEFAQAEKWGISGFPACLMETEEGRLIGISRGFLPLAEMESRLEPHL